MPVLMVPRVLPSLKYQKHSAQNISHRQDNTLVESEGIAVELSGALAYQHVRKIVTCSMKNPEPHQDPESVTNSRVCYAWRVRLETTVWFPWLRVPLGRSGHDEKLIPPRRDEETLLSPSLQASTGSWCSNCKELRRTVCLRAAIFNFKKYSTIIHRVFYFSFPRYLTKTHLQALALSPTVHFLLPSSYDSVASSIRTEVQLREIAELAFGT
jgi:hypothetical protein